MAATLGVDTPRSYMELQPKALAFMAYEQLIKREESLPDVKTVAVGFDLV